MLRNRRVERNGRHRDDTRSPPKGDDGTVGNVTICTIGLCDSHSLESRGYKVLANPTIRYDGPISHDSHLHNEKYNEKNGRNNIDGDNNGYSRNRGVEGEIDDLNANGSRRCSTKNVPVVSPRSCGLVTPPVGDEPRNI